MGRTTNLRRQHDAAVDLIDQIQTLSERLAEAAVPYQISMLLAKLTGLLRIHFAQEDKTLYPYMIQSAHDHAARTAADFQTEMGGLAPVYEAFARRWASADQLRADATGFRAGSAAVFGALAKRVEQENEILYPLADDIKEWQVLRSA